MYSMLTGTHMEWDLQIVYIMDPMIENYMLSETERTQKFMLTGTWKNFCEKLCELGISLVNFLVFASFHCVM